jgi:coenzyme F420 biosynthesis associated uncharacterized protein
MVDWVLAGQIARYAAGRAPAPQLDADVASMADDALVHVSGYTGLTAVGRVPRGEVVSREEWADINLATLTDLLDPVAARLQTRLDRAGPLSGALRTAAGATLAAEAGLVVGYMSQRVLGQFELSLLTPEQPTRLLFVGPNLANATRSMDVDADSFLRWVALHEVTHVLQFTGVPWLREHMGGLMRSYMKTLDVQINRGAAGGLPSLPDPARLYQQFREGGLMALIQTGEQRKIMDQVQATMAVIEGYSEHVMDAVGETVLPAYAGLRDAMDARRASRSTPERILQKLLGFDLKMRQYEVGKRSCDAVAADEGIAGLNRVWESPASMPTLSELSRPAAWSRRATARAAA